MKVLIDADACPVTQIAIKICHEQDVPCLVLCDTAHEFSHTTATVLVCDKGSDSTDFSLVNRVCPGDIVITQDYGLASMCLARNARVMHQDGWEYTADNIGALLFSRHETRKYRAAGGRTKGPKKRTEAQNSAFIQAFSKLLQG